MTVEDDGELLWEALHVIQPQASLRYFLYSRTGDLYKITFFSGQLVPALRCTPGLLLLQNVMYFTAHKPGFIYFALDKMKKYPHHFTCSVELILQYALLPWALLKWLFPPTWMLSAMFKNTTDTKSNCSRKRNKAERQVGEYCSVLNDSPSLCHSLFPATSLCAAAAVTLE